MRISFCKHRRGDTFQVSAQETKNANGTFHLHIAPLKNMKCL